MSEGERFEKAWVITDGQIRCLTGDLWQEGEMLMLYRDRRLTGAIHGEWAPTLDGARALLLARCEAQATALRRGAAEYEAQAARLRRALTVRGHRVRGGVRGARPLTATRPPVSNSEIGLPLPAVDVRPATAATAHDPASAHPITSTA